MTSLIPSIARPIVLTNRDYVETHPGRDSSLSASALVASVLYASRVYPDHDFIITKLMWCNGAVVAGNVEVCVWTFDGTTWTRAGTSGTVAQSGATAKQVVTGLSIPVYRALPTYLSLMTSDSSATFARSVATAAGMNDVSASGIHSGLKAAVGIPAPGTVTAIAADIRTVWIAGAA